MSKTKKSRKLVDVGKSEYEPKYSLWDLPTAAQRVSEGLSPLLLERVRSQLGLSYVELSRILQIPQRTLARRKTEDKLSPDESERVLRIARLAEMATSVFGSSEEASAWMKEPNFALGEKTPLEYARTEPGAELVENVLIRIDHGIPV